MIKVNNKTVSKMYFQKGGTSADAFLPVEIKRVYYNEQCVFDSVINEPIWVYIHFDEDEVIYSGYIQFDNERGNLYEFTDCSFDSVDYPIYSLYVTFTPKRFRLYNERENPLTGTKSFGYSDWYELKMYNEFDDDNLDFIFPNFPCLYSGWLQLTSPSLTESMEIKSQNDGIVNINCIDNLDLSADYLHNSYISNKSYF